MALLTKTHKVVQPNALASELADAREVYISTRNSVVDRAVQRQNAIDETIVDLEAEGRVREDIVQDARKG